MSSVESSLSQYLRDPDVQLMLRVRQGDDAAFTQLVANYQDRLISVLYHLVRDQEAAEDLAQEVFLRIYRNRERYKPKARFVTWIFRIANNLASNARRNKGRRKEVSLSQPKPGSETSGTYSRILADKSALMPVRLADRQEVRLLVQNALDALNDRQRLAVLLHKFENMSYADIGETMDLSTSAVKSLLSRAREVLRTELEHHLRN
ncbi:MAG: sigma-70 family RNA polymerase sigma factor [Planctomycetaceae bacterium]